MGRLKKRNAEAGDAATQYNLGLCYEGTGITVREAFKWYTRAAEGGAS